MPKHISRTFDMSWTLLPHYLAVGPNRFRKDPSGSQVGAIGSVPQTAPGHQDAFQNEDTEDDNLYGAMRFPRIYLNIPQEF